MATTNIRFLHQQTTIAGISNVQNTQSFILNENDSDLGYRMYGYKDGVGNSRRLLAKDENAKVDDLYLTDTDHSGSNLARIIHSVTDTNNYIQFEADKQTFYVGGANAVVIEEAASDTVTIGFDTVLSDGVSLTLQESIDFVGATTENQITIPDNLANALDINEGGNSYIKLVTTNSSESIVFGKTFSATTGSTIGNLTLADGSITDSGGSISFGDENLSTTGTLGSSTFTCSAEIELTQGNDIQWSNSDPDVLAAIRGTETDATAGAEHGALDFYTADVGDDGLAKRWYINHDGKTIWYNANITWSADQESAFGIGDGDYALGIANSTSDGSFILRGFSQAAAATSFGIQLDGRVENDPSDFGAVHIRARAHDGAGGLTDVGSSGRVMVVENNNTNLFGVLGGGKVVWMNTGISWSADQESAFGIEDSFYALTAPDSTSNGGLILRGYTKEAAGSAFGVDIEGLVENDPSDTGCIHLRGRKHDGAGGLTTLGDDAHLFVVENNNTNVLTVYGDGDTTFTGNITIPSGGYISSAGDTDSIQIAASGAVTFSQPILAASGAVGAPGIAFSADTDTGLYYTATQINFAVAGSQIGWIDGSGMGMRRLWLGADAFTYTEADLLVYDATLDTNADYTGAWVQFKKTAGATNTADDFRALYLQPEIDDTGQAHGNFWGLYANMYLTNGEVGAAGTAKSANGLDFTLNLDGGKVWGNAGAIIARVRSNAACDLTTDLFGAYFSVDNDIGTHGGTSYMCYLDERSNIDYGYYQGGTSTNRFGGDVQIDSDTNGTIYGDGQTSSIVGGASDLTVDYDANDAGSMALIIESGGSEIARFDDNAFKLASAIDLDCATNGAYFKPRRVSQSAQPTPDSGEMMVWRDSDDSKTYIVYNDTDEGVRKVEMT